MFSNTYGCIKTTKERIHKIYVDKVPLVEGMVSDPERKHRGSGNVLFGDGYTDVYFIIQYHLYVLCTF